MKGVPCICALMVFSDFSEVYALCGILKTYLEIGWL